MREVGGRPFLDSGQARRPRVSVIVIFLNAEKFIDEAVESVFSQTYHDWEVLLVDDGSTDGTTERAQWYAGHFSDKVRYLQHSGHENRGTSAARNLGLRNAMGDYIALLDADDVWLPHKLERQVGILDTMAEAGMVYGATEYWHSWIGEAEHIPRDDIRDLGVRGDTLMRPPTLLTLFLRGDAVTPSCSNVMLRRCVMETVGGFEEEFRGLYDDQAFWAKVCLNTPVFVSTDCWDRYRQRTDSCYSGAKRTKRRELARLAYLRWLEAFLVKEHVKDPDVWQALREKQQRHRMAAHRFLRRLWRTGRAIINAAIP